MKNTFLIFLLLYSTLGLPVDYVIEMDKPLSKKQIQEISNFKGVQNVEKYADYSSSYFDRLYSVKSDAEHSTLIKLKSFKLTRLIEKDFDVKMMEIKVNPNSSMETNDLLFPQQWGLYNQGAEIVKQRIGGGKVTFKGAPGADIQWKDIISKIEKDLKKRPIVAVVDMGIDLDHPELKESIYKNKAECDKDGSVRLDRAQDLDGNGLPADCHGWNCCNEFS